MALSAAAQCQWEGEVIVNSNHSYGLKAYNGQRSITFVIHSQCRLDMFYDLSGNLTVRPYSVGLQSYQPEYCGSRIDVYDGGNRVESIVFAPQPGVGQAKYQGQATTQPNSQSTTLVTLKPGKLSFTAFAYEADGFPRRQEIRPDSSALTSSAISAVEMG